MTTTRISALIPAYNAARFLNEALASVFAQSRPPDEVIVVDDGSTDGTAEVAARWSDRIRFERLPHVGVRAARAQLLAAASGDWIAFLDADDLWLPHKLERQLAVAAAYPEAEMVYGQMLRFRDGPAGRVFQPAEPAPLASASLILRAAFVRDCAFAEAGAGEFAAWLMLARGRGLREVRLDEPVLWRRLHDDNIGVRERAAEHGAYLRAARAAIASRRGRAG